MQPCTGIIGRNQNIPMKMENIDRHRYMDRNEQFKSHMNLDGKYAKCQGAGFTLRDIQILKSLAHSESEISCKVK